MGTCKKLSGLRVLRPGPEGTQNAPPRDTKAKIEETFIQWIARVTKKNIINKEERDQSIKKG
jgi:hypothetical protein